MIRQIGELVLPTADVVLPVRLALESGFHELEGGATVGAWSQGPLDDGRASLVEIGCAR